MAERRGGKFIVIEGEADGPAREGKANERTGEVPIGCQVMYWGGSDYVRLEDPKQGEVVRKGVWLRLEGPAREFKDNMFMGAARITHVDGIAYADYIKGKRPGAGV